MGNVKTLVQHSKMLVAADNSNGEKRIDYQYDLISGKVNKVIYQPDKGDQFIHRYDYDADNRIISVNTSRDGLIWQNDAKYVYHLHGPLARTELGDQKVQGLDYAYTLQGWLKGVNSSSLHDGLFDIGQDGKTGGSLPIVGRDAYGYMLDYYVGDYKPIGQQAFSLNTFTSPSPTPATGFKSLYNGNIGGMVTNIRQLNTPQYTYYHYDQLNRIKRMEALHGQNAAANTWNFGLRFNGYIESFTYDPNGNIKTLSRNSNVEQIDDLTYNYLAGTNKLTSVTDPIASGLVNYDIDGQGANNYSYDRIGNVTSDNAEGITSISWTVYGKIKTITKSTGTIDYRYDASGNRIYKKTVISGATTETFYARDAQGNVMAVYEKQAANPLKWMEQHLYGSSRLGMWNLADVVPGITIPASGGTVEDGYLYGSKFFELSNHLGNVLVTVSDKKIGIDDGANGTTDYFQPEVLTAQDYYSFGMSMPGRKYTKPNSGYRYGFNGKENDNEVKGEGSQQDYGFRVYDPRIGKFLSVDPLTANYPELTPYQFSSNTPVQAIDLDGLEAFVVSKITRNGETKISLKFDKELRNPGGVYYVHRYYSDPTAPSFLTSQTSGTQSYSDYERLFPNFSNGQFTTFSDKLREAVVLKVEANVLFAEVGLEGKFAGTGLGGSFGGNGKLIGMTLSTDDNKGIPIVGWQSTFRGDENTLEVGGGISYVAGVEYRHKFDLSKGFIKDSKIGYNGIVTSAEVNPYTGDTKMSWGLAGKAAMGLGINFDAKLSVDIRKLAETLKSLTIQYSELEKLQMSYDKKGTKEFDPENY